ncbi:DUF3194 domain-containing protein [Candidatus Bathyarchaeota archaeon]|nr:DUF3194 domain-containing protein [Candidatus Bathyarchaeota archaeon]
MFEEIGLPELKLHQIEEVCKVAEEAARRYILSKVSFRRIADLNITIDISVAGPVTINVDIDATLSPLEAGVDVGQITREASEKALEAAEGKLREFAACKSKK